MKSLHCAEGSPPLRTQFSITMSKLPVSTDTLLQLSQTVLWYITVYLCNILISYIFINNIIYHKQRRQYRLDMSHRKLLQSAIAEIGVILWQTIILLSK